MKVPAQMCLQLPNSQSGTDTQQKGRKTSPFRQPTPIPWHKVSGAHQEYPLLPNTNFTAEFLILTLFSQNPQLLRLSKYHKHQQKTEEILSVYEIRLAICHLPSLLFVLSTGQYRYPTCAIPKQDVSTRQVRNCGKMNPC